MMERIRIYLMLFSLVFVTLQTQAQNVADIWISMPEEIVPYLNLNMRKEMVECHNIGVDTTVKNKFEGSTSIDTLLIDYGRFLLSEARVMEIVKLPCESDSIIMLIDSYKAPEIQSEVRFYDTKWNTLSIDKIRDFAVDDLFQKPDTMPEREFEELKKLVVDGFLEYNYDFNDQILEVKVSLPLVTLKEQERLNAIICKQKLKWDGKTFN